MVQICLLMAHKLLQEVILALKIVRHYCDQDGKRDTSVWRFLGISGPSRSHGMGSESKKVPIFERLIEEEECDGAFLEGVFTSSAFMVSAPRRLMVWTSLSSRTVPFGLNFLGLEDSDIVGSS